MKKICIFLVGLVLLACTDGEEGNVLLPGNSGKYGEILVVADSSLWNTPLFDELTKLYQAPVKILPQQEPTFKFIKFQYRDFSPILRLHKNIIFIQGEAEKTTISERKNVWSKDQYILTFKFKDQKELISKIEESEDYLLEYFILADIKRIQHSQRKASQGALNDEFKQKRGYELIIPRDFTPVVKSDQYIFMRREKPNLTQCLFIYEEDYVSKNQLSKEYLLNLRDSLGKEHLVGEAKNSYMKTERRAPVYLDVQNVDDQYAMRLRGLWRMVGEFKGGSFVSYSYVDTKRNKLINIEGFLYCPKYKKRFYMQELEAIIRSLKFQKNTVTKKQGV